MKIVYAVLEGTDEPWIDQEIQHTLGWASRYEFGPEFWGRLSSDLNALWQRRSVDFLNCKRPVHGFKAMMTNSAITVYPQVRVS
jgi:hypothetical protein